MPRRLILPGGLSRGKILAKGKVGKAHRTLQRFLENKFLNKKVGSCALQGFRKCLSFVEKGKNKRPASACEQQAEFQAQFLTQPAVCFDAPASLPPRTLILPGGLSRGKIVCRANGT